MSMFSRSRAARLTAFGLPLMVLGGLAALIIGWWPGSTQRAAADFPHAGVDLSVGVGGSCDSSAGPAKCTLGAGATFTLEVRLNAIPGGFSYAGYDSSIDYSGVTLVAGSLMQQGSDFWPPCTFPASDLSTAGHIQAGCASGIGALPSTYTGLLMQVDFQCASSGTITLLSGVGATALLDDVLEAHGETGSEALTINCGAGTPVPTTPAGPTNTPGPATPTRTPAPKACGDVNDNGSINPVDATLILQLSAGLLGSLLNAPSADVNNDSMVNPVDATLILQFSAGLVPASGLNCG